MTSRIAAALTNRILVLDGAMGTTVHQCDCDLHRDYLGKENCTEVLLKTRPEVIQGIHELFFDAGADAVETNSFGSNQLVLAEFDLQEETRELNRVACEVAHAAAARFSTPDRPRFVLGSMGPGTRLLTLGNTDWETMLASYTEQARGLIDGRADAFIIETCQDIQQVKCAINACLDALADRDLTTDNIPIMVSVTMETTGTMLLGSEIAAVAEMARRYPILSLGLNCATGPTEMSEHVAWLSCHWDREISVVPNAGLPVLLDGKPDYPLKPAPFTDAMINFAETYGVNIVGGCCGTTVDHIRALAEAMAGRTPTPLAKRAPKPPRPGAASLYSATEFRQDTSFLIVGERTNTNGSRKFKRLINEEDWDAVVAMGKELVRDGSHVLDVSVDYVGRDGVKDMRQVVSRFAQQITVPLMIDSTQVDVLEEGLKRAPGKAIINSMNLEDGEEKLGAICRLATRYGAAVVAGTIDEDPEEAMGKTAARKIAIAERIFDLATRKHGVPAGDILFDPLVLPVTTGVEADRRLALETIEGIHLISERLPECQTMIGVSNVSFGLKPNARVVLNSVFLHECLEAGLTGAIVHASKILPRTKIDDERWNAALDLIYDRRREGFDPLTAFIDLFRDDEESLGAARVDLADLPLAERLQRHIIDGETEGLPRALDEALAQWPALQIVNEHLLGGMKVVGELFASGEMQLPFVLQSAQVMKQAVAHLEPHMPKTDRTDKGRIILATVQGDVHDIGKNLVDIILTNNGYTVVNLGIKQPLTSILRAYREQGADAIGLSGLLVKSVGIMHENLAEMSKLEMEVPVILGGAALTRHYAEHDLRHVYGRTYYGKDAFEGLRFMDALAAGRLGDIDTEISARLAKRADAEAKIEATRSARAAAGDSGSVAVLEPGGHSDVATDISIPAPPFWGERVITDLDLAQIYPYVNKVALYRGQWRYRKGKMSDAEYQAQLEDVVEPIFRDLCARCAGEGILSPRVVYGWFPAQSQGDDLIVYDPQDPGREIERFTFPRQPDRRRLCIADFFRTVDSGEMDVLGLHCVTMGQEVSRRARDLFEADRYTDYLHLHGMGVECAEALAELWHKRMRTELGIAGEDSPNVRDLFVQRYRGSRYSFGYPACPEMADQEKLFRLLKPERIGCRLTENWQIDPEQSTSAIIVHHPEAKYFNVKDVPEGSPAAAG